MVCVNIARYAISCRTYTMWCVVEHLHVSNEWPRISHRAYKRHDTPASKKRQNDTRGGHLNCNRLYIYNHLVPIDIQTKKIHRKKNIYHICVEHLCMCGCKKIPGCWVRCKHLIMAMKKKFVVPIRGHARYGITAPYTFEHGRKKRIIYINVLIFFMWCGNVNNCVWCGCGWWCMWLCINDLRRAQNMGIIVHNMFMGGA